MNQECVILVDESDRETGTMEKLKAHQLGALHRAFSVCIFDGAGRILIHRRASGKYHSSGLWTNTCCSHPRPGEDTSSAAHRRLIEEMGFSTPLQFAFSFVYHASLDSGLIEHELDHVYTGMWEGTPTPDPSEVSEWKYAQVDELISEMDRNPERFTAWFKILLPNLLEQGFISRKSA